MSALKLRPECQFCRDWPLDSPRDDEDHDEGKDYEEPAEDLRRPGIGEDSGEDWLLFCHSGSLCGFYRQTRGILSMVDLKLGLHWILTTR